MHSLKICNPMGEYITVKQAAESANIGIATAKKYAEQADAVIHIGRCVRIDRKKYLEYISQMK